jgi:hypothetical protein
MTEDRAWFAPKRFGYGAGLPIAWQGWAVLAVYLLVTIGSATVLIRYSIPGFVIVTTVATAVLLPICRAKTRGGWRWRNGGAE